MALEWIKGSTPQFWKNYLALFENDEKQRRFVVFDIESSASEGHSGAILSIGAIGISGTAIEVGDFFEVTVGLEFPESNRPGSNPTGSDKVVEAEAMIRFLNFIKNATLVGHNATADVEMVNQALKRLALGRLKNDLMDTNVLFQKWKDLPEDRQVSLDEVCDALKVQKSDRHTPAMNAYVTALVFLKLMKRLGLS